MASSPQTLFHFTKSIKSLKGILSSNFKLSYAKETIYGKNQTLAIRTPMVSFCDLRLSEIKEHIEKYGNYGIGMKKEWGIKKNLNPVLYLSNESHISESIINLIKKFDSIRQIDRKNLDLANYLIDAVEIAGYIKNQSGILKRGEKDTNNNYIFADEREWRYKLTIEIILKEMENGNFVGFEEDMNISKPELNKRVKHLILEFNPEDINYIIVKNDSDIIPIINHISTVNGSTFTADIVSRLKSRIITVEQIMNDF